MIQKYKGTMELVCDKCGDNRPPYDDDEFNEMIASAKGEGWSITRQDGHWTHECGDCVREESALSAARRKFGLR